MNRNRVKGKIDEIAGRVKQSVGGLTGNRSQQASGVGQEAKGKVRGEVGKAQEDWDREVRPPPKRGGW